MDDDKVLAFDTLYTNNQIQLFKIILPYLEPKMQSSVAILIKYMELRYTIAFCHSISNKNYKSFHFDIDCIIKEAMPFCNMAQKESLKQIQNIIKNYRSMKDMMETMEMLKDLFPEGMDQNPFSGDMDLNSIINLVQSFSNS